MSLWVRNVHREVASNAVVYEPVEVRRVRYYYDSGVDVVSIRLRDGEPKYVIEGSGNFVIFADDLGVWSVDLEVKKWGGEHGDVVRKMKMAGFEMW